MKQFLFAILVLSYQSSALADVLSCQLKVGHAQTSIVQGYQQDIYFKQVKVSNGRYTCDAEMKAGVIKAILYVPGLAMDQDIAAASSSDGTSVSLKLDDAQCDCGLM